MRLKSKKMFPEGSAKDDTAVFWTETLKASARKKEPSIAHFLTRLTSKKAYASTPFGGC